MIKNKRGQGLVEFALILPLLMMLLLGIIEGGRIIWAYVTVQNAAREAARYAVTGRPFACGGDPVDPVTSNPGDPSNPNHFCDNSVQGDPWSDDIGDIVRVQAIENIAINSARNLTLDFVQGSIVGVAGFNAGQTTPGTFGVLVIGQDVDHPAGEPNLPGKPGWNIHVKTYYNVEMIDPIFDAIMGGQVIHLAGEVELQNEGIDAANKGNYAAGISYSTSNCPPDCGSSVATPYIVIQDQFGDMSEPAGGTFTVYAEDHLPNSTYNLWFEDSGGVNKNKVTFTTNNLGSASIAYVISVTTLPSPINPPLSGIRPPTYKIYTSLQADGTNTPVATCSPGNTVCFAVSGAQADIWAGNIGALEQSLPVRWPISSSIPIWLYGHDTSTSYPLTFNGQSAAAAPGSLFFEGASVSQITTDASFGSNLNGSPGYYIATGHTPATNLSISSGVATTTIE